MEQDNQQQAKFSYLSLRELILTFLYKTIEGSYKRPKDLKDAIIKSYKLNGIDLTQKEGLLMALELDNKISYSKFNESSILSLIKSLYKENYITSMDYVIALNLGANNNLFSLNVINRSLEEFKINPDKEINKEELEAILKDIENL